MRTRPMLWGRTRLGDDSKKFVRIGKSWRAAGDREILLLSSIQISHVESEGLSSRWPAVAPIITLESLVRGQRDACNHCKNFSRQHKHRNWNKLAIGEDDIIALLY